MKNQKPNTATRTLHDFWSIPTSSSATVSGGIAASGSASTSNRPRQEERVQQGGSRQQHVPVFAPRVQPSIKKFASGDTVHVLSDDDDDQLIAHAIKLESLQKKGGPSTTAEQWQEYLPGFDVDSGQHWLYPRNKPKREYQYAIVKTALFHNTLVSLPTGLGKTFIAAVVMYNFYRWYPTGKVLFVAPTRPLVEQQIEACYNIVGIPQKDMCALTGKKNQKAREEDWRNHRVFFLTPHVLTIDLERNVFPTDDIKCLVVDEAHKATGNYVYCQAVQRLLTDRVQFRVLGLSATPGNDVRHVQQVINNLLIAKVETRTEISMDVKPYVFGRTEEKLIVRLEGDAKRLKEQFENGLEPMIDNLRRHRVVESTATVDDFSLFKIKLASDSLRTRNMDKRVKGSLMGQCAVLQSLYHSYDLLIRHGLRALYRHLNETMKSNHLLRSTIERSESLTSVWEFLSDRYGQMTNVSLNATIIGGGRNAAEPVVAQALDSIDERVLNSHPKMKHLGQVLNAHFSQNDDKSTRAIVFSSYRDSVDEIADFLRRLKPLIRPAEFKGQQSKRPADAEAGPRRGQTEQLRTIQDFQSGKFNVLVSTCVGEEGLDIGEVDLIVCYDTNTSGIRQVQRMGRTGRKRQGRIVHLLTEHWEEKNYNRASKKNKTVQSAMNLAANVGRFELFSDSPRMVPLGLAPTPLEVEMTQSLSFVRDADRKRRLRPGDGTAAAKQAFYAYAGYLTEREMAEWDRRYKTDFEPAAKRRACMTSMGDRPQPNAIDLSSHSLWQDREQPVGAVKHSALTSRFVAIMRGSANGGGAAQFDVSQLDEEDVLRPGQADNSVRIADDIVDIDMEAEMAKFDATASSTVMRKPLRTVQAEQKKLKTTKKRTLQKKTTQKPRGGKQRSRGKQQPVIPDSMDSAIEFIEMRRPVTAADYIDLRDAVVVAERTDRLRVLLGLLDAQCELLDWHEYLDDSFDSLMSGIEDVNVDHPVRDHGAPPATNEDSSLSVDTAVRMLAQDHGEMEADCCAHQDSTSESVHFDPLCLGPPIATEPSRSNLENGTTQVTACTNIAPPLPIATPFRSTATTSMLGFDFNISAKGDDGPVVKQNSFMSTELKFDLMTPQSEKRLSITTELSGLFRVSTDPMPSALQSRNVRVEQLRCDWTSQTPVRLLRSASSNNTSLGFSFDSPLVDEAGATRQSRPSMITALGFSFAPQPRSSLIAKSDSRSRSPSPGVIGSELDEDTVPPSPNAVTCGSKSHQLLGGVSRRL